MSGSVKPAAAPATELRTVLLCHAEEELHRDGIAWWLASETRLAGIVLVRDPGTSLRRRIRREMRRSGLPGLLDSVLFRVYHRIRFGGEERRWRRDTLQRLRTRYPALTADIPTLITSDPNSGEVVEFVTACRPDLSLAFLKHLLKPAVFTIPRGGTLVMHPGICPEYRNSHGCFWAIARGDLGKVGMTLLRIDQGVDTGPIFGYFRRPPASWSASPIVLQHQVVLENLPQIQEMLHRIAAGSASTVPVSGRTSAAWGQPKLSAWLRRPRPGARIPPG